MYSRGGQVSGSGGLRLMGFLSGALTLWVYGLGVQQQVGAEMWDS